MKKTFKFFLMAAIVAAGFTACSSEEVNPGPGPDGNGEIASSTYATFKFENKTKALIQDTPESVVMNDLRVLIFSGHDVLDNASPQIDTLVTSTSEVTIYLPTSGDKKIFVVSNDLNNSMTAKETINFGTLNSLIDVKTDLSELNKVRRTTDGLFMLSNGLDSCNFTLVADIKKEESQDAASRNNIKINVRRTIAKLTVTQDAESYVTADSKGKVNSLSYRMWNVNKDIYPIYTGYAPNGGQMGDSTTYKQFFGYRVGTGNDHSGFVTVSQATAQPAQGAGGYYYITENKQEFHYFGNTTYAAVKATFLPKAGHYFSEVTQFTNVGNTFTVPPTSTDITVASNFWKLDSVPTGYSGLTLNGLYASESTVKKIVYHFENPGQVSLVDATTANTVQEGVINKYFTKYENGTAWYRLNIGEGEFDATKPAEESFKDFTLGVERNSYYWAQVKGFGSLGAAKEEDLLGEVDKPIKEGPTYLTVVVSVIPWEAKAGGGIL